MEVHEFFFKLLDLEFEPLSVIAVFFQLGVLAWVIYQVYSRFQGSQAERILRGLFVVAPIVIICYAFKLTIITKIFEIFSQTLLVGLTVIFAPELRRVLIQLGGDFSLINFRSSGSGDAIDEANEQICSALKQLSDSKTGAILIIEKSKAERYYINAGSTINSDITAELLVTIFSNKTPLHDGAVIVRGTKLASAGVILPMTENPKLNWQYGTRHRAAIGFSEVTGAICFVVSEETGYISVAQNGKIRRLSSMDNVKQAIRDFYESSSNKGNKTFSIYRRLLKSIGRLYGEENK